MLPIYLIFLMLSAMETVAEYNSESVHHLQKRGLMDYFGFGSSSLGMDNGLIIEGRDDIFEKLMKLFTICRDFLKTEFKFKEQQGNMDSYTGRSKSIVKQVQKDVGVNACQNIVDVFAAYHQALINDEQNLPYYYENPGETLETLETQ